ncbi:MAG TPA: mannitol-1-phosphate 5-dehydrogenase [Planococcus sp. (in: firmicutes)]|nr:mannitol-1-phosphate 5-dehydrogenase [Planococcus sp. (in: firmicutes)]
MKAVHFGAGNIGRGFIGALLYSSGFETIFIDVNGKVIDAMNEKGAYEVTMVGGEQKVMRVENVSGINSLTQADQAIQAIARADLVTTAIGPNILPAIAGLLAEGIKVRLSTNPQPLNIIACENMISGSSLLREYVMEHLTEEEMLNMDKLIGFPDAAVDRIVPDQHSVNPLDVSVETYYEWVVEEPACKGEKPPVTGITYVEKLEPFIERKLFTVNTGHAVPAYFGRYKGYQTIYEAMQDAEIVQLLEGALRESGEVLIELHHFDRAEHEEYIKKIIGRFRNPDISDHVARVGRGPIRKLGRKDRLIRPATLYFQLTGQEPKNLARVIAAALLYVNDQDEEAQTLQQLIEEKGFSSALQEVGGLRADDPLIATVLKQLEEMKR